MRNLTVTVSGLSSAREGGRASDEAVSLTLLHEACAVWNNEQNRHAGGAGGFAITSLSVSTLGVTARIEYDNSPSPET